MRRIILFVALLGLVAAASAQAWEGVTVELSKPPALVAGKGWRATLSLRGPNGEPVTTASAFPGVVVRKVSTGRTRMFLASKTAQPGVYRVRIVFPSAGRWTYRADAVAGNKEAPYHVYKAVRVFRSVSR